MSEQKNLFDIEPDPWILDDLDDYQTASIVFSDAPYGPYDYLIPDKWSSKIAKGMRVRVPLGRSRSMLGYCIDLQTGAGKRAVDRSRLKEIGSLIDETPLVSEPLLELAVWISEQYLCPLGTVIETIVPSGVRTMAGTREVAFLSVPNPVVAKLTQLQLPKKQAEALKILAASSQPLTIDQLATAAGCSSAPIKSLCEKKLIQVELERIHGQIDDGIFDFATAAARLEIVGVDQTGWPRANWGE